MRAAYYNLVGAIAGLDVAQQSLDLARQSLKDNRTRVEVGTMAPIDVVSSEAEVASNEENVIVSEAAIQTAQDQLRALIMNPSQPGFWDTRFKPSDQPMLAAQAIDIDAADQERAAQSDRPAAAEEEHGEHRHQSALCREPAAPGGGPSGAIRRHGPRRDAVHLRQFDH